MTIGTTMDDIKTLRLLVAVDGSIGSRKALIKAAELAKEAVAYEMVLVHVVPLTDSSAMIAEMDEGESVRRGNDILDEMEKAAAGLGVGVNKKLLRGNPAQAVLDYAQEFGPDMIVVSNRGANAARSALAGSVSSAISRKAKHPVLVVR